MRAWEGDSGLEEGSQAATGGIETVTRSSETTGNRGWAGMETAKQGQAGTGAGVQAMRAGV